MAKLLEETRTEFRASFKEIAKAQLELKGDLRDFKGQANATICASFRAYLAPIFAFTALADACGFSDNIKAKR